MTCRLLVGAVALSDNKFCNFNQGKLMAKTRSQTNLSHRPTSYWEHRDPLQAILAGISGRARREMIRAGAQNFTGGI